MTPSIVICYWLESSAKGWIVWRAVPGLEPEVISPYPTARPRPHLLESAAKDTIENQKRADRAAATRLGVEIRHP